MDDGGIEPGWKPSPPPPVGSDRWKTNIAVEQVLGMLSGMPEESCVLKMMPCVGHDIGYLVIKYEPRKGWDYFRVDSILDVVEECKNRKEVGK